MDDLYRENILDHYENPRNYGTLESPDFSYRDFNPLCGDEVQIDLQMADGKVGQVCFEGKGCAISLASASMLTEMAEEMTLEELRELDKEDILESLGIPLSPVRLKCALLPLKALKAGVYGLKGWPGEEE